MLDDDDEVLRIVCEVLLQLMDYIGGQEFCHCLIPPYETLCVVEELSIRTLVTFPLFFFSYRKHSFCFSGP
jgi:hypothetical protein